MKPKKLLRTCRKEKREIVILAEKCAQLEASLLPKSLPMLSDRIQSSPDPDPIGERLAAKDELRKEIDRQLAVMIEHDLEAHRMIANIEDSTCRQVLELYYLSFLDEERRELHTWETVSERIGYSVRQTLDYHSRALQCLGG